jgi:hypothetical protein
MASNLAEFAASTKASKQRKCFTCSLPPSLLEQVEAARAQSTPIFYSVISKWLATEDHEISLSNLRNHFQARHHEDAR